MSGCPHLSACHYAAKSHLWFRKMKAHTCVCHDGEQPGFSVSPGPQVNASNPMNHKTLGRTKKATLREARAIGH